MISSFESFATLFVVIIGTFSNSIIFALHIFAILIPSLNKNCLSSYAAREEFPAVEKVSQGIPDVTKSMPPLGTNGSICSAVTFLISECITCTSG